MLRMMASVWCRSVLRFILTLSPRFAFAGSTSRECFKEAIFLTSCKTSFRYAIPSGLDWKYVDTSFIYRECMRNGDSAVRTSCDTAQFSKYMIRSLVSKNLISKPGNSWPSRTTSSAVSATSHTAATSLKSSRKNSSQKLRSACSWSSEYSSSTTRVMLASVSICSFLAAPLRSSSVTTHDSTGMLPISSSGCGSSLQIESKSSLGTKPGGRDFRLPFKPAADFPSDVDDRWRERLLFSFKDGALDPLRKSLLLFERAREPSSMDPRECAIAEWMLPEDAVMPILGGVLSDESSRVDTCSLSSISVFSMVVLCTAFSSSRLCARAMTGLRDSLRSITEDDWRSICDTRRCLGCSAATLDCGDATGEAGSTRPEKLGVLVENMTLLRPARPTGGVFIVGVPSIAMLERTSSNKLRISICLYSMAMSIGVCPDSDLAAGLAPYDARSRTSFRLFVRTA
mmetsp:Transcript_33152/g.83319  ORF Transcript_33152/g.83319 Transcript_33152/m.83319 type:complete len:456 (+) Transcript_33152:2053-3420(+)